MTQTISINPSQLEVALSRVAPGLEKYCWLQNQFTTRNVATDAEFQKRFAGFYRVRRNGDWRAVFFRILEGAKTSPVSFADALNQLRDATGQVEASFASKLAATVNPDLPVIDSVVVGNLGLTVPKANDARRIEKLVELHWDLVGAYAGYLASAEGDELVAAFQRRHHSSSVSRVKMLDLVLWQIRA